jgi:hypothetical protein
MEFCGSECFEMTNFFIIKMCDPHLLRIIRKRQERRPFVHQYVRVKRFRFRDEILTKRTINIK